MMLLYQLDILNNKKVVFWLNILALPLMIVFFLVFSWLAMSLSRVTELSFSISMVEMAVVVLAYFLLLIVHELIHGLFFKIFNPTNKVKFGVKLKAMMAYATSPGSLYSRKQMFVIGLSPFVGISLGLTVMFALGWLSPLLYVVLAAGHAAGCVGDFYYAYLLLIKFGKEPILVEDTETGLLIYKVEEVNK